MTPTQTKSEQDNRKNSSTQNTKSHTQHGAQQQEKATQNSTEDSTGTRFPSFICFTSHHRIAALE
jgi:hypothetical protein